MSNFKSNSLSSKKSIFRGSIVSWNKGSIKSNYLITPFSSKRNSLSQQSSKPNLEVYHHLFFIKSIRKS